MGACVSWLYSRALVAEYSADTCSDGAPFAQLSAIPTPLAYCAPDKMTDFSRLSRYGTTFVPLTDDRGRAVLTWYRAGFHVKTYQAPEREPELPASDRGYGEKWRVLSVRYDRATSSWKTHQCLLSEVLPMSSVTLPRWGMLRLGELLEHRTWGRRITGNGSGSLALMKQGIEPYGKNALVAVSFGAICTINTPTNATAQASKIGILTPIAPLAKMWPTPAARDYRFPNKKTYSERGGGKKGEQLPNAVGGPLNPTWVEWLMGWPLGWTDLKPLETGKYLQWRRLHGAS